MNIFRRACLAVAFVLLPTSLSIAEDQLLLAADGLRNSDIAIAVSDDGRAVLVVVGRDDITDGDFGEVHGVILKHKKSKYVVKKQFLISVKGETAGNPDVIWDAPSKQFIVVWDSVQQEAMNEANRSRILARLVSKKGKVQGKPIFVVNSNHNDERPALAPLSRQGAAPSTSGYRVFFTRYPLSWGNRPDTGIWSLRISNMGKPLDEPGMVRRGTWQDDTKGSTGRYWYFGIIADRALYSASGSAAAATEIFGPVQDVSYKAYLLRVNGKGVIKALVDLPGITQASSFNADAAEIGSGSFLTSWYEPNSSNQFDRVFNTNLLPEGGKTPAITTEQIWYSTLAPLDGDAVLQFCSTAPGNGGPALNGGSLYAQQFNSKGKREGDPIQVLDHGGSLSWVRAAAVPGSTHAYAVWVRDLSESTSEVHGVHFDFENPKASPRLTTSALCVNEQLNLRPDRRLKIASSKR